MTMMELSEIMNSVVKSHVQQSGIAITVYGDTNVNLGRGAYFYDVCIVMNFKRIQIFKTYCSFK